MYTVGVGQEPESVDEEIDRVPMGVGGAAKVPAQASRAGPGTNNAGLPALSQDLRQVVHAPNGHEVDDAASFDVQHVLRKQVRAHGCCWHGASVSACAPRSKLVRAS